MRHKGEMIAARRPSCRAALLAALASAILAAAPGTPARALVATPDVAAAEAAGPVSTAALGARCIGPAFDDTAAFQAAIDTGHTVYAPALGGQCHITHALVMRTPGQIFHGDGRARTKIVIDPGFTGEGVFVAKTGEPGPVWRDFSVSFVQPDTDDRAKLTRYPPAFSALNTPRFQMEQLGCYGASTCVDMKGNSGGAIIADLQMSAFNTGIDIDGSLDTIRISHLHWFPFNLSEKQLTLFFGRNGCPVGIHSGRADNLVISTSLFGGCLGLQTSQTSDGATSGIIISSNFDTYSGIVQDGGVLLISICHFALGTTKAVALDVKHGIANVSSSFFLAGANISSAMLINRGAVLFTISSSTFLLGDRDVTVFEQVSGVGRLAANTIIVGASLATRPLLNLSGDRLTLTSNEVIDSGAHRKGTFLLLSNFPASLQIANNVTDGWNIERAVKKQ